MWTQHRAHFFAVSAQIMRHRLLDRARRRIAAKRGGAAARLNLEEVAAFGSVRAGEMIALDGWRVLGCFLRRCRDCEPSRAIDVVLRSTAMCTE